MDRLLRGPMLTLLLTLAAAYLAIVGYLYLFQRSFVFHPGGALLSPAEAGLPQVGNNRLTMPDGVEITAWHAPPRPGMPTLLYFHGNAGNISYRAEHFRQILESGFGLMAPGYRGFPGSGGSASEAALVADALVLYDWLAERGGPIVLHGESLGSGIAVAVAAERDVAAIVLEAPYTAAVDVAAEIYPWVPVAWLMKDQFRSRDLIASVDAPLIIVHGAADRVVPSRHGERLYQMAGEPKRLVVVPGAGHEDLWTSGLWPTVLSFLRDVEVLPPAGRDAQLDAVRPRPSLAGW
ncbi:MAG TPA: alpha/beta hydrolase [Afifellaceae bacterium]|nr:alpha/beta hydrolase [Afifellaceae bacterium]